MNEIPVAWTLGSPPVPRGTPGQRDHVLWRSWGCPQWAGVSLQGTLPVLYPTPWGSFPSSAEPLPEGGECLGVMSHRMALARDWLEGHG